MNEAGEEHQGYSDCISNGKEFCPIEDADGIDDKDGNKDDIDNNGDAIDINKQDWVSV